MFIHGITNRRNALPPKFDAGGISGVTGSVTVKVLPVALPVLVVICTAPVVAACGTVKINCVGDALVTVANTPLTVTMLFAIVPLKFAPTTVTDTPRVPLVGVNDEITGASGFVDPSENAMLGFKLVESYAPLVFAVTIKSIKSPADMVCVTSYAYVVASLPLKSLEYSVVADPYLISNNTPSPADKSTSATLPVIRALPLRGAVQRKTDPTEYPGWHPVPQIPKYTCAGLFHNPDPDEYVNKDPDVSR